MNNSWLIWKWSADLIEWQSSIYFIAWQTYCHFFVHIHWQFCWVFEYVGPFMRVDDQRWWFRNYVDEEVNHLERVIEYEWYSYIRRICTRYALNQLRFLRKDVHWHWARSPLSWDCHGGVVWQWRCPWCWIWWSTHECHHIDPAEKCKNFNYNKHNWIQSTIVRKSLTLIKNLLVGCFIYSNISQTSYQTMRKLTLHTVSL